MLRLTGKEGFTLIEITIAILILTTAVLGIAATTGSMIGPAADAELNFVALQSVEDRLSQIRLDPRYAELDSLYEGTETGLPGLPNITRTTSVTRTRTAQTGGKFWDYTTIVVTLSGGRLTSDVFRKLVLGAP
jgi:Tfp pilus assembly protein PilV